MIHTKHKINSGANIRSRICLGRIVPIAVVLVVITLAVCAIPVVADDPSAPSIPMQIYGTAYDDSQNSNLAVNKEIVAHIGDETHTFKITEAGKIGGSGTWDDKWLITPNDAGEGDQVYFTIDGVRTSQTTSYQPGKLVNLNIVKPGDTTKTEVKNTTSSWNAANTGDVGYTIKPSALSSVPIPTLTNQKSGKSIDLDEKAKVYIIKNGVETEVDSQYVKIEDGIVSLTDGAPEIASTDQMKVVFVSRPLGDPDGDGRVTVNDAVRVAQSLVSIVELNEKGEFYGDTDGDGRITVNDAVKVAQRLVNLVDENYEKI